MQDITIEESIADIVDAEKNTFDSTTNDASFQIISKEYDRLIDRYDQLFTMIDYIKRYGVNRSFLSLCNYDNILNDSFNLNLPACESFDAVGSPQAPESIAALESLGEIAITAWEHIKKFFRRLLDYVEGAIKFRMVRLKLIDHTLDKAQPFLQKLKQLEFSSCKGTVKLPKWIVDEMTTKDTPLSNAAFNQITRQITAKMDSAFASFIGSSSNSSNEPFSKMLTGLAEDIQKITDLSKDRDTSEVTVELATLTPNNVGGLYDTVVHLFTLCTHFLYGALPKLRSEITKFRIDAYKKDGAEGYRKAKETSKATVELVNNANKYASSVIGTTSKLCRAFKVLMTKLQSAQNDADAIPEAVSANMRQAVANKDIEAIRDYLWACIVTDISMTGRFKTNLEWVLKHIPVGELYEPDNNASYDTEPTKENFAHLSGMLKTNFSKEKLQALRKMASVLYPPK